MKAAAARRAFTGGGGSRRREALKGKEVQAGRRGDKRGRWAVDELLDVRRVRGRGRKLDVHVRWSGGDAVGGAWEESWVGITWLTPDLRQVARGMEAEIYKVSAPAGQPTGPTTSRSRRTSAVYGASD